MPLIIIYTFFTVIAVAIALKFNCKLAEGYPLAAFFLICTGVVLGVLKLLSALIWLAVALFVMSAAFIVYRIIKKTKLPIVQFAITAAIAGALLTLMWALCRGHALEDWDDFSHWGTAAKIMYNNNALDTDAFSLDKFREYPPAATIFQYLLLKLSALGFREDIAIFANATLICFCALLFIRAIDIKKRPLECLIGAVLIAFVPSMLFPRGVLTLGVDMLLGAIAAFAILCIFLQGKTKISGALLALSCAALTMVKASGFGLALLVSVIAVIFQAQEQKAKDKRAWLITLSPAIASVAARLLWSAHCALNQIPSSQKTGNALTAQEMGEVVRRFWEQLCAPNFSGAFFSYSYLILLLVFFLMLALAAALLKQSKAQMIRLSAASAAIVIIFTVSLLFAYLFAFDSVEALILASMVRYLNTVTVLMLTVAIASLIYAFCQREWKIRLWLAALLVFCGSFMHGITVAMNIKNSPQLAAKCQQDMFLAREVKQRLEALGQNPKVHLISGNDAGAFDLKLRYEMYPSNLPNYNCMLRATSKNIEPWQHYITLSELSRLLAQDFDYLFIYTYETQFLLDYLPLFENEADAQFMSLFKVIKQADGTARLRLVP